MSATTKTVLIALLVALVVTYFAARNKIPIVNPGAALPKAA
jgi:hypothetical protein